jgi:hypothetical protein
MRSTDSDTADVRLRHPAPTRFLGSWNARDLVWRRLVGAWPPPRVAARRVVALVEASTGDAQEM